MAASCLILLQKNAVVIENFAVSRGLATLEDIALRCGQWAAQPNHGQWNKILQIE